MDWNTLLSEQRLEAETEAMLSRGREFENDYQRIITSSVFRRLQDKSQVFPLDPDDYVRTRLTHSLEVSSIGKLLGEAVHMKLKQQKADPYFMEHSSKEICDVMLCAGLIHDIGNPPYGHFGEFTIREWFRENLGKLTLFEKPVAEYLNQEMIQDLFHFEGNAQSFRILTKSPYMGQMHGLNLTSAVLAATFKYPVGSGQVGQNRNGHSYKKMGYYYAEKEKFAQLQENVGTGEQRHPLSFLLEAADDIAYRCSDVEDAASKNILSWDKIDSKFDEFRKTIAAGAAVKAEYDREVGRLRTIYREEVEKKEKKPLLNALQRWNQGLRDFFVRCAADVFTRHYREIMEGSYREDLFYDTPAQYLAGAIESLCEAYVYTSKVKIKVELHGRKIIKSLLDQFIPAALLFDTPYKTTYIDDRIMDVLSNYYKSSYFEQAKGRDKGYKIYLRILMTADFISGMTDRHARQLYQEIC